MWGSYGFDILTLSEACLINARFLRLLFGVLQGSQRKLHGGRSLRKLPHTQGKLCVNYSIFDSTLHASTHFDIQQVAAAEGNMSSFHKKTFVKLAGA